MSLPHLLKRVRLELARSKEFPMGSATRGYEFVAPLDRAGHIALSCGKNIGNIAVFADFGMMKNEQVGRLVHKPGGAEHARWVFDYDTSTTEDDEAGYRFGAHAFSPGEYVSIRGDEGEQHTFRVVTVEPAA